MAEWEQWEAVQGPRSHCGPSSSVTRRYGGPWPMGRVEAMGGRTGTRSTVGPQQR
ncbi:unnamed protein product, partial [Staurois parvus]